MIISHGIVNASFSIILQGYTNVLTQVLTLSHITHQSFLRPLSISFHFTITFMFELSCLRSIDINHAAILTLFHITDDHIYQKCFAFVLSHIETSFTSVCHIQLLFQITTFHLR